MTGIGRAGQRSGRSRWLGWVAVVAILIQTLVPHVAMAARESAAGLAGVAAEGLCLADSERHGEASGRDAPALTDPAMPCAFCLALSAHGLAPVSGAAFERAAYGEAALATLRAGVLPRPWLRHSLSPRAPPGV